MGGIPFEPPLGQKTSECDSKLLHREGEGVNSSQGLNVPVPGTK